MNHATSASGAPLRAITALSAASFAVLGACLTLPGTLLPVLVEQFGIRLVEAGSMLALQPIGYLLSVVAAGRLIKGYGVRVVLAAGVFLFALGFAGFGLVSSWLGGAAVMFVAGLGFGVVEVAINALLVTTGGERSANLLNLTHLFFGVGSFVAPALTAVVVAWGVSWRAVFLAAGLITALVAAGWSVQPLARGPAPAASEHAVYSRNALVLAVLLGAYVGAEMGIGGWLTKYMVAVHAVPLTYASNVLSLYWLGLTVGRVALSVLAHYVSEQRLLLGLTAFAALALGAAQLAPYPSLAAACLAATGLGFSGIFPAVIAMGGRSHPHDVAGVTSVMVSGAGIGNIVIPWAMSAIADAAGLTAGMGFYWAICLLMVGLAVLVLRWLPRAAAAVV